MSVTRIQGDQAKFVVNIANGAAISDSIRLSGMNAVALILPAAWTAADLTFQMTTGDGATTDTWISVWDDANAEVKVAAATMAARVGDAIVDAGILRKLGSLPVFRLQSGVKGAQVAQGGARQFTVICQFI